MTLSELGDLGDFLGGIGVVATLAYLAIQIRQNTQAVRTASLDSVTASHLEFQRSVWGDPTLNALWFDGLAGKRELSEADGRRFMFALISCARHWESAYQKARGGTLDSTPWASMHEELSNCFANPGAQKYWQVIRNMFSPDFIDFAENAVRAKRESTTTTAETIRAS